MKLVALTLATPIQTPQGPSNSVQHGRVTDVVIKDNWLKITLDGGIEIAYNLAIVIQYVIDPHGSVVKPGPGALVS